MRACPPGSAGGAPPKCWSASDCRIEASTIPISSPADSSSAWRSRALVGNPSILLADEPTGALDQKTGRQVMELFGELSAEGRTIIMITHDMKIAAYARRVVHIIDGELQEGGGCADA